MPSLDRRTFVLGAAGAAVLAACGGDDDDSAEAGADEGRPEADDETTGELFLVRSFPEGIFASGSEQRVPFVLRDEVDVLRSNAPAEAEIVITLDGEQVGGGVIPRRDEGLITPYYPVFFTPPSPGTYTATLIGAESPLDFMVDDPGDVLVAKVGEPLRVVDSPTVDDMRGVDPICTRAVPCPFHELNLADVAGNGRPTALIIATPGWCQTDVCGPVVDLLIDEAEGRDGLDVVHAEVYTDPTIFDTGEFPPLTDVVNAYALQFEPQMLVADAEGQIVARLDVTWDRSELRGALDLVA